MDKNNNPALVCPECGSTDIVILEDESVAICNDCLLEWPWCEK